jgi:hypothetical protein
MKEPLLGAGTGPDAAPAAHPPYVEGTEGQEKGDSSPPPPAAARLRYGTGASRLTSLQKRSGSGSSWRRCCCACLGRGVWRELSGSFWLATAAMVWASFCFGMQCGALSAVLGGGCESQDECTAGVGACYGCPGAPDPACVDAPDQDACVGSGGTWTEECRVDNVLVQCAELSQDECEPGRGEWGVASVVCPGCLNCELGLSPLTLALWLLSAPLCAVLLAPLGLALLERISHPTLLCAAAWASSLGWLVLAFTPGERGLWQPTPVANDVEAGRWLTSLFLFGGRLLTGAGLALGAALPTLFLRELTLAQPRPVQATLARCCQLALMLGTLLELALGAAGLGERWRWLYALNACALAPLLGALLCVPPSPRWLHRRNRRRTLQVGLASAATLEEDEEEVREAAERLHAPTPGGERLARQLLGSILAQPPDAETTAAAALLLRTSEGESAEGEDVLPDTMAWGCYCCCDLGGAGVQREVRRPLRPLWRRF